MYKDLFSIRAHNPRGNASMGQHEERGLPRSPEVARVFRAHSTQRPDIFNISALSRLFETWAVRQGAPVILTGV